MEFTHGYILCGLVLLSMSLIASRLARLPASAAMVYLGVGVALGPSGLGLIRLDWGGSPVVAERLAEAAILVALFTAGLKLRAPFHDRRWLVSLRLAFVAMTLTIGLIAAAGVFGLGLSLGAAILLGALLAPTDPVLAAQVAVEDPLDRDELRFALTGEAGLNDGAALPFALLGLGLLGLHDLGSGGWRWLFLDLAWSVFGGLAIGGLIGALLTRLVLHLRREHREATGRDEFLGLGLIALAYGVASLGQAAGFLSVFAAGVAMRCVERRESGGPELPGEVADVAGADDEAATHPEKAPAYLAASVLAFCLQLERVLELGMVLLIGAMISTADVPWDAWWFIPLVFLIIRPAAVAVGLLGVGAHQDPASPDRVVRHPRHRRGLLPGVRGRAWNSGDALPSANGTGHHRRGGVLPGPWNLGDSPDATIPLAD